VGGFRKAFGVQLVLRWFFGFSLFLDSNLSGFFGPSFSNPHFLGLFAIAELFCDPSFLVF
jgi:hypothetical protein